MPICGDVGDGVNGAKIRYLLFIETTRCDLETIMTVQ